MRALVVTLPRLPRVRLELGGPLCRVCKLEQDDGRHRPVSECFAAYRCEKPREHHVFRAQPWWRRLRRERSGWS